MNPIQFNALAIVFIMAILPFSVAFITNLGASGDGEWIDSKQFEASTYAIGKPLNYVIENGGDNYSSIYRANDPADFGANRTYITNGECPAEPSSSGAFPCLDYYGGLTYPGEAPMQAMTHPMSHFTTQQTYIGASGNGPFEWFLTPRSIDAIDKGDTLDKMRLTFIDQNTDHNCGSSIFVNLTFTSDISFIFNNKTKTFSNFQFETSNLFQYSTRRANWVDVCQVGFALEYDFNGFETVSLTEFNGGNWNNTSMVIKLDNFQRKDGLTFGSTALPFAGIDFFTLGIEHQPVNPVEAGFVIKTGTIALAVGTFVIAIASTPYWQPFRNFFKGALN